jgi:hypothetical protein
MIAQAPAPSLRAGEDSGCGCALARWLYASALTLSACFAAISVGHAQAPFQDRPQGYVRLDTDLRHNQVWLGGALPVGPIDLQGDLLLEDRRLRADAGVAFYAGALSILPMLGVSFDFGPKQVDRLIVPRLFAVLEAGPLYIESWLELTLRDALRAGARDDFYTRDFVLFTAHEYLAIGPQFELRYALQNGPGRHTLERPFGGQIATHWGASTFALFLGYETSKLARGDDSGVVGRFTFARRWQ